MRIPKIQWVKDEDDHFSLEGRFEIDAAYCGRTRPTHYYLDDNVTNTRERFEDLNSAKDKANRIIAGVWMKRMPEKFK